MVLRIPYICLINIKGSVRVLFVLNFCAVIFTVRNSSCGKVMFLHLSVSHSVHGGRGGRA